MIAATPPLDALILFLCTGNICRSPMAEAIARRELAVSGRAGVAVASAGVAAEDGGPATALARRIAAEHGLDLSGHRSRRLTPELAAAADLVVAMEPWQAERARELGARNAVVVGPVADPYGYGEPVHRRTWAELERLVPGVLEARFRSP